MLNVSNFSKETLAATTGTCWKIDVNIVIFSTDWFFNKRLVKDCTVNFNEVISFHHVTFCCGHITENKTGEKTQAQVKLSSIVSK